MIAKKKRPEFVEFLLARLDDLKTDPRHQKMFTQEMQRFVFAADQRKTIADPDFWDVLILRLEEQANTLRME